MHVDLKHNKYLIVIISLLSILTTGCQTVNKPIDLNFYPYSFNQSEFSSLAQNKTVFVAPIQLIIQHEPSQELLGLAVDENIENYLVEHGYQILPVEQFTQSWNHNKQNIGGLYDQNTGKLSSKLVEQCIENTMLELKRRYQFAGVVIPYFSSQIVKLDSHSMQWGVWDGVKRNIAITGYGDYRWNLNRAISLNILIYSSSGQLVFRSKGGLDFDTKSVVQSDKLQQQNKTFEDYSPLHIREAVEIAFYPFFNSKIVEKTLPDSYLKMVQRKIRAYQHYPKSANNQLLEGEVSLRFHIRTDGTISTPVMTRSSDNEILNQAALDMVLSATPLPVPPSGYFSNGLDFEIPMQFRNDGQ